MWNFQEGVQMSHCQPSMAPAPQMFGFSLCVLCLNQISAEQIPLAFCGFWRGKYCYREALKQLPPPLAVRYLFPSTSFPFCCWLYCTCLNLLVFTCKLMLDVLVISVICLCSSVSLYGVIFLTGVLGCFVLPRWDSFSLLWIWPRLRLQHWATLPFGNG